MDGQLNDTMDEHVDNLEDDDLQPHDKYLSIVEKRQRKIDVLSSKKQVAEHSYETTNLDYTPATINNSLQTKQDDYVEHEDLSANCKYNCTKDKVVAKEKSATTSNFEASDCQQKKISTRPRATVPASKHHRVTTNWSTGNSITVGTKVWLQSWKNQNKSVAMGTVVSCDPTETLDGVRLGKEFWMVSVSFAIVDDEPLIRPYKGYEVLGDVEGGVTVAWPSTFIKKINM